MARGKVSRLGATVPEDTHTRCLALALALSKDGKKYDRLDVEREAVLIGLRALEEGASPIPAPSGVTKLIRRATDPAAGQGMLVEIGPRVETPNEIAWRTWRTAYRERYGMTYPSTTRAGSAMVRIATAAVELAGACERPGPQALEELLSHWWLRFLADPGFQEYLREGKHRVEWAEKDLQKYGDPWTRKTRKPQEIKHSEAAPTVGRYAGRPL